MGLTRSQGIPIVWWVWGGYAALQSDRLSYLVRASAGPAGAGAHDVVTDPVFQNLRVAQEDRALLLPEISETNGALSFGSVLSLPVALQEMTPRLAAADGDPATAVPPDRTDGASGGHGA